MSRLTIISICEAFLAALLAFSIATIAHADVPPHEVKQAAERGLPDFLNAIPREDLERYGFKNEEELKAATLGEPYRVYTIVPERLASYKEGTKLSALISETNSWYFPVMVEDEARTILTVSLLEGRWQAVDIGGLALPQQLQMLSARLPTILGEKGISGGYSTKFVRVFQLYADFLAVDSDKGEFLVPLLLNPDSLGIQNYVPYTPGEVMPQLTKAVQQQMRYDKAVMDATWGGAGGPGEASVPKEGNNGRTIYLVGFLGIALLGLIGSLLKARKVF